MNKVILSGNLCQETEVKQTPGGKEVVTNCVAVQRDFKNANGEYESDFINIVVWGQPATYLGRYARKGDRVELVGRWQVRKYTDNNGMTRVIHECIVESVKAFSRQQKDESKAPEYNPYSAPQFENITDDEDLPF